MCDITDENQIKESIKTTILAFGRLDVLVNNAGTSIPGSLSKISLKDFDAMYKIHVRAPMLYMQLALPYLEKSGGNIINISSLASGNVVVKFLKLKYE